MDYEQINIFFGADKYISGSVAMLDGEGNQLPMVLASASFGANSTTNPTNIPPSAILWGSLAAAATGIFLDNAQRRKEEEAARNQEEETVVPAEETEEERLARRAEVAEKNEKDYGNWFSALSFQTLSYKYSPVKG